VLVLGQRRDDPHGDPVALRGLADRHRGPRAVGLARVQGRGSAPTR
jgi:hypothetical protein